MRKDECVLLAAFILAVLVSGCQNVEKGTNPANGVLVDNPTFEDVLGSDVLISFDVNSNIESRQECIFVINLSETNSPVQAYEIYSGAIEPTIEEGSVISGKSSRTVLVKMPSGKTSVSIESKCEAYSDEKIDWSVMVNKSSMAPSCENIQNPEDRVICDFLKSQGGTEKYSQCFDGRDDDMKYFCMAFLSNDYRMCNNIRDYEFYKCLAIMLGDESYCQRSPETTARDICNKEMATSKKDPSICNLIEDTPMRLACRSNIGVEEGYEDTTS